MSEPAFASLSPTLLARKGGAKPAMRPQLAPLVTDGSQIAALADDQLEDLGWNDMGDAQSDIGGEPGPDKVPIKAAIAANDAQGTRNLPPQNPVVRRRPRGPARVPARAPDRRAAFTLRLDAERHLKLRLAATMQGVSAQALLTEALDAMLAEFDGLDVIAAHLKRH
jgi:hypothetical protein